MCPLPTFFNACSRALDSLCVTTHKGTFLRSHSSNHRDPLPVFLYVCPLLTFSSTLALVLLTRYFPEKPQFKPSRSSSIRSDMLQKRSGGTSARAVIRDLARAMGGCHGDDSHAVCVLWVISIVFAMPLGVWSNPHCFRDGVEVASSRPAYGSICRFNSRVNLQPSAPELHQKQCRLRC